MSVEAIPAPEVTAQLIRGSRGAFEALGMRPDDATELLHAERVPLGMLAVGDSEIISDRFFVGRADLTGGGGLKWKLYPDSGGYYGDGFAHAADMVDKAGVLGQTGYRGAKGIANFNHRAATCEQLESATTFALSAPHGLS